MKWIAKQLRDLLVTTLNVVVALLIINTILWLLGLTWTFTLGNWW
jgi:hypothetical protein